YRHAYDATLRASSRTWGGVQHPTFRYEFRGEGKIVLTALQGNAGNRASVVLPNGRSYLLMLGSRSGPVVAEVSEHDVARRISVKPGTYWVLGRTTDYLLEGSLDVGAGDTVEASDDRFSKVAYARLVRKGAATSQFVHGPQAGYRVRTALQEGAALCHG